MRRAGGLAGHPELRVERETGERIAPGQRRRDAGWGNQGVAADGKLRSNRGSWEAEQQRRSVAMLPPEAAARLSREKALAVVDPLRRLLEQAEMAPPS